jgi:hypothetical protein
MAAGDKFEIKTSIDASGVQAGADQTIDAVKGVEKATEAAGEGIDTSVLSNRRNVAHFLRGLEELKSGGVDALAGLASEGFVATEAFEAMLGPLAPIFMAITLIASIGIPMFEKMNEKTGEAKDKEDEFGAAAKSAGEASKTAIEAATAALKDYLDVQKQIIEGEQVRAEHEKSRLTDLEKQHEATVKLHLSQLELQKQTELGTAKTQLQRDAIEAKYKAQENQISGAGIDQKHADELATMEAEKKANKERYEDLSTMDSDRNAKLKELEDRAAASADKVGVAPDAMGSFEKLIKNQKDVADKSEKEYRDAQEKGSLEANIKQKEFIEENIKLADLMDAQKAHEELIKQGGDLKKAIEDSAKEIDKLADQNDHLEREKTRSETAYQTDKNKSHQEGMKDDQDAASKATKDIAEEKRKSDVINAKANAADHKELEEAVSQAASLLHASGNKNLIESYKKLSAGLDLQQKAALLLAELASSTDIRFQEVDKRLADAEAKIQRNRP